MYYKLYLQRESKPGILLCIYIYSNPTITLPIRFYQLCIITNSVDSFDLIINRIRMELYL